MYQSSLKTHNKSGSDYSDHGFFQEKVAPKGGLCLGEIPWGGFEACEKAGQLAPQLLLLRRSEKAGVPWWHKKVRVVV